MSVATLRAAITERAAEMRGAALLSAGLISHKRGWRDCPCRWCETKREATLVIGSHVPLFMAGCYVDDIRHIWREEKRQKYRAILKELEHE